jgi:hypothetical protein
VRWKRATPEHYDPEAVGWATESVATPVGQATLDTRRVIDTTAPGLSNAGHVYGDGLTADDRAALLEYRKAL